MVKLQTNHRFVAERWGEGEYESLTNNISRLPLKFEDNEGTSEDLGLKSVVLKHMALSKQK